MVEIIGLIELFSDWRKSFGNAYRFWVGYKLYIVLSGPKDIEKVMNNSLEKDEFTKYSSEFLGDGLFTSPGKPDVEYQEIFDFIFNFFCSFKMEIFSKNN